METVEFRRGDGWSPRVIRSETGLQLEVVGGADALHDPRVFRFPIEPQHFEVIRRDLARHLILWSALMPLCHDAGTSGPIDAEAATALLNPLLLGDPDEVDAVLGHTRWDRGQLVAHGAELALLNRGRIHKAMGSAHETADWSRAQQDHANRQRAQRGVRLSPLDEAVLRYTGQLVHGSTIPRRLPEAVDEALLPHVLRVVQTAERAREGLRIARDPRRGTRGTDRADWTHMESAVETVLRRGHPELAADAVRTISFLMCSEASNAARDGLYDADAEVEAGDNSAGTPTAARVAERVLAMSDDQEHAQEWSPGDPTPATEVFWGFVAEHFGSKNEVFTLEDESQGDGIQLMFYADSIARVATLTPATDSSDPVYRVEYGKLTDLAHYRAVVRLFVAGGFNALDELCHWYDDPDAFEVARRRRG